MPKIFRPSNREESILSKIESSNEYERKRAINKIKDCIEALSNAIAMKLIENNFIETTNKNSLEKEIKLCLDKLTHSQDFDVDFQIAPLRTLVARPHVVSLYITSFVIENLINHKDIIDIFGSDKDIYLCINSQVTRLLQ